MSDLADLPRGLLSLEQWDALELDPTRRWELSEGTLIMSPRPQLWHQRISRRLTRLLEDHLPDGLEAVPEIEVITRASFPPSVRDPDIVVVPDRVFDQRPARVPAADVAARRRDRIAGLARNRPRHEVARVCQGGHRELLDRRSRRTGG